MSKKSDLIVKLLDEHKFPLPMPSGPVEGLDLLEHGMLMVLLEHLTPNQAEASVKSLRSAYEDWNELRVSQVQEIAEHLKTSSRTAGFKLLNERRSAAMAVKEYLQDVFQQTHGLELEFLREDAAESAKMVGEFQVLGLARGSFLLWIAGGSAGVPMHTALIKLLEKLEIGPKTTSAKKAKEAVDPLVPKGRELEFTVAIHDILERWNDEEAPPFLESAALRSTAYGKKAANDFEASRAKAEAARAREEERLRKEEERRLKEEERARKKAEAAAAKREAAEAKARAKAEAAAKKTAEREARLKEADRKRTEAAKKAEAARKAEAAKKAAAEKKAEAAKKAAAKKAEAAKKAAARKAEAAKKAAAKKKAASKKTAAKKTATKKTATKKTATKKTATKKTAAKKTTAKKPTAKKAVTKKPAAKKVAKKTAAKKVTKKPAAKKTTAKKAATKKTAAKKKSTSKKATGKGRSGR